MDSVCRSCGSRGSGRYCGVCGNRLPDPEDLDRTQPRSGIGGPVITSAPTQPVPTAPPPPIRSAPPAPGAWPAQGRTGWDAPAAAPYPPPPQRRSAARWLIPLVVLLFLGGFGAALAVSGVFDRDGTTSGTAAGTGAPQPTAVAEPSTPTSSTTAPPPVTETVTETASTGPEPVTLPAEAEVCKPVRPQYGPVAYAARGNDVTTCPFSLNVQEAYVAAGGVDGTIVAYSPRTEKTYSMACTGTQPAICRGGNNAVVFLFEGEPRR